MATRFGFGGGCLVFGMSLLAGCGLGSPAPTVAVDSRVASETGITDASATVEGHDQPESMQRTVTVHMPIPRESSVFQFLDPRADVQFGFSSGSPRVERDVQCLILVTEGVRSFCFRHPFTSSDVAKLRGITVLKVYDRGASQQR